MKLAVILSAVATIATLGATNAEPTKADPMPPRVKIDGFGFKKLDFNGVTLCGLDKGNHVHCTPYDPVNRPLDAKLKWSQKGCTMKNGKKSCGKLTHIYLQDNHIYGLNGLNELYRVEFDSNKLEGTGTWTKITENVKAFVVNGRRVVVQRKNKNLMESSWDSSTWDPFTEGTSFESVSVYFGREMSDHDHPQPMPVEKYVALDKDNNAWSNDLWRIDDWKKLPIDLKFKELKGANHWAYTMYGVTPDNKVYISTTPDELSQWTQFANNTVSATLFQSRFLFGTTTTTENYVIDLQGALKQAYDIAVDDSPPPGDEPFIMENPPL